MTGHHRRLAELSRVQWAGVPQLGRPIALTVATHYDGRFEAMLACVFGHPPRG